MKIDFILATGLEFECLYILSIGLQVSAMVCVHADNFFFGVPMHPHMNLF